MADDLGYADVACYGRPDLTTPNIDRLAAKGVRFLQAYANSAVCTATRTALITGRYQYRLRARARGAAGRQPGRRPAARASHPAVAAEEGRLRHDADRQMAPGRAAEVRPAQERLRPFLRLPRRRASTTTRTPAPSTTTICGTTTCRSSRSGYLTELLGDRAVDVVNGYAKSRQPFLLSLHFNAPHWPWEAPGRRGGVRARLRRGGGLFDFDGGSQKTYQRMIEAMDRADRPRARGAATPTA